MGRGEITTVHVVRRRLASAGRPQSRWPRPFEEAGDTVWRDREGQKHRVDGPAVESADGTREWWQNGELHREDGPAIERADGYKAWYQHGKHYREDDRATIEYPEGYQARAPYQYTEAQKRLVRKKYLLARSQKEKEALAQEVGVDSLQKLYNLASRLGVTTPAAQAKTRKRAASSRLPGLRVKTVRKTVRDGSR